MNSAIFEAGLWRSWGSCVYGKDILLLVSFNSNDEKSHNGKSTSVKIKEKQPRHIL